jgi:hypothetical protein
MRSAKAVVSEKLARLGASNMSSSNTSGMHASNRPHTITSLRRWSIVNKELPGKLASVIKLTWDILTIAIIITAMRKIRAIHVYDFDNTRKRPQISVFIPPV